MKLSKPQIKAHETALSYLEKEILTFDEKVFVYENWLPAYGNQIGKIASFFTPYDLAKDLMLCYGGDTIIDLCAGIGILSFVSHHCNYGWVHPQPKYTCVELNEGFVSVGKKLLPEANWIQGDILDKSFIKSLGEFDVSISNPPYGLIKTGDTDRWMKYKGSEFEYLTISVASEISKSGAFIIPQMSSPWHYSGKRSFERDRGKQSYQKFFKETGIELKNNCGIDTSIYKYDWVGTSIITELVICDFQELRP